jgi:hypothetical protein
VSVYQFINILFKIYPNTEFLQIISHVGRAFDAIGEHSLTIIFRPILCYLSQQLDCFSENSPPDAREESCLRQKTFSISLRSKAPNFSFPTWFMDARLTSVHGYWQPLQLRTLRSRNVPSYLSMECRVFVVWNNFFFECLGKVRLCRINVFKLIYPCLPFGG